MSEEQRHLCKREFDSELTCYKRLCAELDQTSDRMHKLSRELDTLGEDHVKYQVLLDVRTVFSSKLKSDVVHSPPQLRGPICFLITGCGG